MSKKKTKAKQNIKLGAFYSTEEVADMLGFNEKCIRKIFREGTIPANKIANKWRCTGAALWNYFEQSALIDEF
ncbi:helix-turn-helix domain-containing protein [Lentisphaerota bacterium WC36G]|nr:helix-turn-helix domain-containing protein [Lentisphaerae bacterium WC36]